MNRDKPTKRCIIFHTWSKWEQYDQPIKVWDKSINNAQIGKETRQKRICLVCNKVQDVLV